MITMRKILLYITCMLTALAAAAQENYVTVTLNLVPPYSTRLSDYTSQPGKLLVTLRSTSRSPAEVYLKVTVKGQNGIHIYSRHDRRPARGITLQPNIPYVLTVADVQNVFDPDDFITQGVSRDDIGRKKGLPEGIYEICLQAYDYNRPGLPVSAGSPLGCQTVRMTLLEPPMPIMPLDKAEVTANAAQSQIFSWSIPAGSDPRTQYKLKVVEMFDPNRNPNDAYLSATGPVFFEKIVTGNIYVFGPADPPLVRGRSYAWAVTALDDDAVLQNREQHTAYRNNGRSEVRSFAYRENVLSPVSNDMQIVQNTPPPKNIQKGQNGLNVMNVGNDIVQVSPQFTLTHLSGKLRYYWMEAASANNVIVQQQGNNIYQEQGNNNYQQVNQANATVLSHNFSSLQNTPLAGVTVQLVEALQFENPNFGGSYPPTLLPGNLFTGAGGPVMDAGAIGNLINLTPLATAITDAAGNFSFNVPGIRDMDFGWKQVSISSGGGEFTSFLSGRARKVLMVKLAGTPASYYAQPIQYLANPVDNGPDMGTFYSRVRTFNPTILVAEKNDRSQAKPNLEVLIVRKNPRPAYIPKDEGSPGNFFGREIYKGSYEVVAKGLTDGDGLVHFRHIPVYYGSTEADSPYRIFVRAFDEYQTDISMSSSAWPSGVALQYATWADHNNPNCQGSRVYYSDYSYRLTDACYHSRSFGALTAINSGGYSLPGVDPAFANFTWAPIWPNHPRVYAQVKNTAGGNIGDDAQNLSGANWSLLKFSDNQAALAGFALNTAQWGGALNYFGQAAYNIINNLLIQNGHYVKIRALGVTGADGRIDFRDFDAEDYPYTTSGHWSTPYYYVLRATKPGFRPAFRAVNRTGVGYSGNVGDVGPLRHGTAYNAGELLMVPDGRVDIRLQDPDGKFIRGKVYYINPSDGQVGEMVSVGPKMVYGQETEVDRYVTVQVPSGNNRKIVIVPTNLNLYHQDTVTINVPANQLIQRTLPVKFKLHQIYFNIKDEWGQRLENVKITLTNAPNATMYPDITSPYLYEGAHSNAPLNPPGNQNQQQNQQNNYQFQNMQVNQLLGPFDRVTNNGGGADFAFRSSGTQFTFRITGPAGSSYIVIDKNVYSPSPSKGWKRVEVQLKAGRTVRGTVTVGDSPVAGARVRVKGSNPLIQTFTNAAGQYELTKVPMEKQTFTASKGNANCDNCVGLEYTEGQENTVQYGQLMYLSDQWVPVGNQQPVVWQGQPGQQGQRVTTINLKLRIYEGLDLKYLLGFPLEVTHLTESGNTIRINGLVSIPPMTDNTFRMRGTDAGGNSLESIDLDDNLVIVADDQQNEHGIPYCRPQALPVITAINEQPVSLHQGTYQACLRDNSGIRLNHHGPQGQRVQRIGVVQGQVAVSANSFDSNIFRYLSGDEQNTAIYLRNPSADNMLFPAFTSTGTAVVSGEQGWPVVNAKGQAFGYHLAYNEQQGEFSRFFTVNTTVNGSKLYPDRVVLRSQVTTSIRVNQSTVQQVTLDLGDIKLTQQNNTMTLATFSNAVQRTIPLDRWSLHIAGVSGSNSGIQVAGNINALGVSIPYTGADLYTDRIHLPEGQLSGNSLSLLGRIPLTIAPGATATFGYDGTEQHAWYLLIQKGNDISATAATISTAGLGNGMITNNAAIGFRSLRFFSNDRSYINLDETRPAFVLHRVARFGYTQVQLTPEGFTVSGLLDLGVPGLDAYQTSLYFGTSPDQDRLTNFDMNSRVIQGVRWHFAGGSSTNALSFINGKLEIKGRIEHEDYNVYKGIAYTLTRAVGLPLALKIDEPPGMQTVQLGADASSPVILSNLAGAMSVGALGSVADAANDAAWSATSSLGAGAWSSFDFNGRMPEELGMDPSNRTMNFSTGGGNFGVTPSSISVKKINTPFGDLTMTYDIAIHRLLGTLEIDENLEAMHVTGSIQFAVDKLGTYFLAAANMRMQNPKVEVRGLLLFGSYKHKQSDLLPDIERVMRDYSYYYDMMNELPKGYTDMNQINGFFMEAGAQIPFPLLPNFDINLVVVRAKLQVNVGGDVRLGVEFGNVDSYHMGMSVFVDAEFALGVSEVVACQGVELRALAGVNMDGIYRSDDTYLLQVSGFIRLTGSAYYGAGLYCDAACDGLCISDTASGSVTIAAIGTVTNSSSSFELEFDTNNFAEN